VETTKELLETYGESESYVKDCCSDCIKENTEHMSEQFRQFFDDY
ncbi:11005_t:CDS:1, partial [Racocetra fulgida]